MIWGARYRRRFQQALGLLLQVKVSVPRLTALQQAGSTSAHPPADRGNPYERRRLATSGTVGRTPVVPGIRWAPLLWGNQPVHGGRLLGKRPPWVCVRRPKKWRSQLSASSSVRLQQRRCGANATDLALGLPRATPARGPAPRPRTRTAARFQHGDPAPAVCLQASKAPLARQVR